MNQVNYPVKIINEFTDGTDTALMIHAFDNTLNFYQRLVWKNLNDGELYDNNPDYVETVSLGYTGTTNDTFTLRPSYYFGMDSSSKNIFGLGTYLARSRSGVGTWAERSAGFAAVSITNFPTLSADVNAGSVFNIHGQFLGVTDTGNCLYFLIDGLNDINQKVYTYAPSDNTGSYLQEWSADRPASGTSVGGTRSLGSGFGYQGKLASTIFDDPNVANTKGFYVPYLDTNENYHPYYFQWDQTNDSFTRNEDISVVTDASSNTLSQSTDYLTGAGFTSIHDFNAESTHNIMFNETFVVNTNRYLIFGCLSNVYRQYDDSDDKKTFITYEVDASDPKKLIYHSNVVIPATPKSFVWLNDSKTFFGIITETAFYMYSFNETTGWENSGTLNKQVWAVGRDSTDRIFACVTHPSGYVETHLITPSLPVVVNISAENETYDYQGSTITSFVEVDAINAEGNRIVTDVTLVIEGTTMTFANSNTSTTVTTSANSAVQVPISIVDAGFSRIISSVTV